MPEKSPRVARHTPSRRWTAPHRRRALGAAIVLGVLAIASVPTASALADARPATLAEQVGIDGGSARGGTTVAVQAHVAVTKPLPTADPSLHPRGPAQLITKVETTDKVVFLTIDDGEVADPKIREVIERNAVPVTVFLAGRYGAANWGYWHGMTELGTIQNHTVNHPSLRNLSRSAQAQEICAESQLSAANTGQTPWMLRPPYGEYSSATLAAAGDCGLDYVVMWSATLPSDKLIYQVGNALRPGEIILTHFRWDLPGHLQALIDNIHAQGYTIARLEDYLPPVH